MRYYLAIDIGASSGRHILGSIDGGKLRFEEIYRFENGMINSPDGLVWDTEALFREVVNGIKKCADTGKIPAFVAIDTWGVDYVLLDEDKRELLPVYAYRNARMDRLSAFPIDFDELYSKTGIQHLDFNTVYQLFLDAESGKAQRAKHFLMIPDYLAYRLTGVMKNEYTAASTTAMVNVITRSWDEEIIERIGLDSSLFLPLTLPGERIGAFSEELAKQVGFTATVIAAPSHDTAAAVAACPIDEKCAYISSGTWSLFGTENTDAVVSDCARKENFSNEGGVEHRYRFLKNIMGTWLFQNVRRNLGKKYTYDEMMRLAMESTCTKIIDVNHPSLNAPENMIEAVNRLAGDADMPIGDTLSCIYHSLAAMYASCTQTVEKLTGKSLESIFIVGGGSKDEYLNALTARYTGKKVVVGLSEAAAAGNIAAQIMYDKKIPLCDVRDIIKASCDIREIKNV
ncbi:MAG: rhamnulokinase [Clostridia bacterium]|nr:rhamnulokinase [Clostridia bacterium]